MGKTFKKNNFKHPLQNTNRENNRQNNHQNNKIHKKHWQQNSHQQKSHQQQQQKHFHPQQKQQQQKQQQQQPQQNAVKLQTAPFATFPKEKIHNHWVLDRAVGPGLVNAGNTCFLNSVLQCLTYTPAFAQYILTSKHKEKCHTIGYCALCAFETHCKRCFMDPKSHKKYAAILPGYFTSNLRNISRTLHLGNQEDAHEFYIFLMAGFQKAFTSRFKKVTPQLEESTAIHQIFGGKIRSQVKCYHCKSTSDNYEAFLDLSLDVSRLNSVQDALSRFTEVDVIGSDPENRYNCSKCKQKVKAGKQMTVSQLPPMLTLHLKRFTFDYQTGSMRKLSQYVSYPETLNMAPYTSKDNNKKNGGPTAGDQPIKYDLHAVLVHSGYGCNSGHYYAFIKDPKNDWYSVNDSFVHKVSKNEVLSQKAYMLFYNARQQKPVVADKPAPNQKEQAKPAEIKKNDEVDAILVKKMEIKEMELRSVLSQKRKADAMEEAEKEAEKERATKKNKRVHIEEPPCSDQPFAWYVQKTTEPQRSLRGVLSPPTYGAAVSDESAWVQLNLSDFKQQYQDKKRKKYRRKKLAGKSLNFTIGPLI